MLEASRKYLMTAYRRRRRNLVMSSNSGASVWKEEEGRMVIEKAIQGKAMKEENNRYQEDDEGNDAWRAGQ